MVRLISTARVFWITRYVQFSSRSGAASRKPVGRARRKRPYFVLSRSGGLSIGCARMHCFAKWKSSVHFKSSEAFADCTISIGAFAAKRAKRSHALLPPFSFPPRRYRCCLGGDFNGQITRFACGKIECWSRAANYIKRSTRLDSAALSSSRGDSRRRREQRLLKKNRARICSRIKTR